MAGSWHERLDILDMPGNQIDKIAKFTTTTTFITVFCPCRSGCISYPTCLTVGIQYVTWGIDIYVLSMNALKTEKTQKQNVLSAFLCETLAVPYLNLYLPWHTSENLPSLCLLEDASLHSSIFLPSSALHFIIFQKNRYICDVLWSSACTQFPFP